MLTAIFSLFQVSSKGLKIIQTVHPAASSRSAVKHLVPGHAVLAAVQREDVVAATLLLPNPATNNPVHVHAYRFGFTFFYNQKLFLKYFFNYKFPWCTLRTVGCPLLFEIEIILLPKTGFVSMANAIMCYKF